MSQQPPVLLAAGSTDPEAPLVVCLHGIGQDETALKLIADAGPSELGYVAVRGPVQIQGGYNWFDLNPDASMRRDTLIETLGWFRSWLDDYAPAPRPVLIVGFSAGAAFAAAALAQEPSRFAGAALLSGSLPWFEGPDVAPGRWDGVPVFLVRSERDRIIPAELTEQTWAYLREESGADLTTRLDPGRHEVSEETAAELGQWLARTLSASALPG